MDALINIYINELVRGNPRAFSMYETEVDVCNNLLSHDYKYKPWKIFSSSRNKELQMEMLFESPINSLINSKTPYKFADTILRAKYRLYECSLCGSEFILTGKPRYYPLNDQTTIKKMHLSFKGSNLDSSCPDLVMNKALK